MNSPSGNTKSLEAKNEAGLIEALRQGDPAAEAWLVDAHRERLYRAAVHFLGWQDPDAEDVVQETFVQALKGLPGFEGRSQLYTWLNQICARQCFRRIRQRQRLALGVEADLRDALQIQSGAEDPLQQLLGTEQRSRLEQALKGLGERCQQVVRLRDLEGKAYVEAARQLKLPIGTFMSRLSRCRTQLKALLKEVMGS